MIVKVIFIYFVFIVFVCCKSSDSKVTENVNNISLEASNDEARRFEQMLNAYPKKITSVAMADSLKWLAENINQYAFQLTDENTNFYLYFTSSYQEAKQLAETNNLSAQKITWGLNGPVLFMITGDNKWAVNALAGYLAGEE